MEVHHHSHLASGETHTSRKKWTHYFWEFLMLFLAVFCGFLAENQREHLIEHNREKQYIETLIEDLKEDTAMLSACEKRYKQKGIELDSLFILLNSPANKEFGTMLYYYGRMANRFVFFTSTDRTIQQMKNSGAFRLIRNKDAANSITRYYSELSELYLLQTSTNSLAMDYRLISYTLFDPVVFETMVNEKTGNVIIKPAGNPSLITYDKSSIQRLSAVVHYFQGARLVLYYRYSESKQHATNLIELLKNKYHLK